MLNKLMCVCTACGAYSNCIILQYPNYALCILSDKVQHGAAGRLYKVYIKGLYNMQVYKGMKSTSTNMFIYVPSNINTSNNNGNSFVHTITTAGYYISSPLALIWRFPNFWEQWSGGWAVIFLLESFSATGKGETSSSSLLCSISLYLLEHSWM